MSGDILQFLQKQKQLISEDKKRLGLCQNTEKETSLVEEINCDKDVTQNNNSEQSSDENKENVQLNSSCVLSPNENKTLPFVEPLDLNSERNSNDVSLEEKKRALIDKLVSSENPFTNRSIHYELRSENTPEKELSPHGAADDNYYMQNNRNKLFRVDQRLTSAQNALLKTEMDKPKSILSNRRTGSPRERLRTDLYPNSFMDGFSYQESREEELERERLKRDAYQYELRLQIEEKRRLQQMRDEQERREQELENKRLEQQLLRMQEERAIDEQRRNCRDEQMRRHSEEFLKRKREIHSRHGYRKHTDSESSVTSCLRSNPTDLTSKSLSHYSPPVSRRNPYSLNVPSTSVFSEPPSSRFNSSRFDSYNRRDTLKRIDSLNSYDIPSRHQTFTRFDSLSKIDSLSQQMESVNFKDNKMNEGQRRHSATHQDLSMLRKSPRLQRRSSSSRFDDSLPIPVLKAHSPVARELKNSIPFSSSRHNSDSVRRLEDRWQIPAVQKTLVNHTDSSKDSQNRSILTQLGAIRMQLQQEQLRMDETLRKRDITQSKAVDFH
nr:trichohyalin isoform X5 [Leptinotarsa decemlineata]